MEDGKPRVYDNEEEGVAYSYSFFHFMFTLGTLYLMLVLTDWYRYVENEIDNNKRGHLCVEKFSKNGFPVFGRFPWDLEFPHPVYLEGLKKRNIMKKKFVQNGLLVQILAQIHLFSMVSIS